MTPGTRVKVFDPRLYIDDVITPIYMTVREATVVRRYGKLSKIFGYKYPDLIDVVFDHDPDRVSEAHFTSGVTLI